MSGLFGLMVELRALAREVEVAADAGQFTSAADAAVRVAELAKQMELLAWNAHVERCHRAGVSPFERAAPVAVLGGLS